MDVLKQAAVAYRALLGKEFLITFSSGEFIRLIFKPGNFAHLAGLHKLTDMYYISSPGYNAVRLYKMALRGDLSYDDLNRSRCFDSSSRERMECICRISELLRVSEKAVHKFEPKKCIAAVKFRADTIFFKDDGYDFFITFGAARDRDGDYHYPETIFYHFDRTYIKDQRILEIRKLEIIDAKSNSY